MKIDLLTQLGIRAADNDSALQLQRLANGELSTGLVLVTGPAGSKVRETALALGLPPAISAEFIGGDPCFSESTAAGGVEIEVIDLAVATPADEEELAETIAAAVEQAVPRLLVIAGEPPDLSPDAEAVAVRIKLDPAAELQEVG